MGSTAFCHKEAIFHGKIKEEQFSRTQPNSKLGKSAPGGRVKGRKERSSSLRRELLKNRPHTEKGGVRFRRISEGLNRRGVTRIIVRLGDMRGCYKKGKQSEKISIPTSRGVDLVGYLEVGGICEDEDIGWVLIKKLTIGLLGLKTRRRPRRRRREMSKKNGNPSRGESRRPSEWKN